MERADILEKIYKSIDLLYEKDRWLIENDLSEQCISHKLAEYLQTEFKDFNVDCEYNGNIDNEGGKKRVVAIKRELKEMGLLNIKEKDIAKDLILRSVFPDIIIYKRGTNDSNLCIIEMKKSTNNTSHDYD